MQVIAGGRQRIQQFQHARIVPQRFVVGIDALCLRRGGQCVAQFGRMVLGAAIVVGYQAGVRRQVFCPQKRNQALGHLAMIGGPLRAQDAFIDCIANQRRFENIFFFQHRHAPTLIDQLGALQGGEVFAQPLRVVDQVVQDIEPEHRADYGGNLKHMPLFGRQAVDARQQCALQRFGQVERGHRADGAPLSGAGILGQHAFADQGLDKLFDIVRVALGFINDHLANVGRQDARPHQSVNDLATLLYGQGRQGQRGEPVHIFGFDLIAKLPDRRAAFQAKHQHPQQGFVFT